LNTPRTYARLPFVQASSAERRGHVVDDTPAEWADVDDSRRDDLASARGLLIGAACGLALWMALFLIAWVTV
jgi:hypothetical protein